MTMNEIELFMHIAQTCLEKNLFMFLYLAKKPNSNINSDLIMKQVEQKYYNVLMNKFVNMRLDLSTYTTTNKTYSNETFCHKSSLFRRLSHMVMKHYSLHDLGYRMSR